MHNRRSFIGTAAATGASLALPRWLGAAVDPGPAALPAGAVESAVLEALPGKRPLIKRSFRPPNFETPVALLDGDFTPNDAFFVRYHLSEIPWVDATQWRLKIGGDAVRAPYELTLAQLKQFEIVEFAAVCLCSGSRRGLFEPHVPGVQWGHGAMGNALWKGVRLKDVLERAGIAGDALEVWFDGADGPVLERTPDYRKSIPIWRALDESVLLAFEMNGAPLPHWNGYPVRLVVPGWTATYWMKHVNAIQVQTKSLDSFWMKPAYRIPLGKFDVGGRFYSQDTPTNTPITEMVVNSLVIAPDPAPRLRVGDHVEVRGVAWDGGSGIARVDVSIDDGASWRSAALGTDNGRFSWRRWSHRVEATAAGSHTMLVRATSKAGASQPSALVHNPAGYHNNVIQRLVIEVA